MLDVTAIGELLIDFTPDGASEGGNARFERNPGGAPANVLAALSKWGKQTAFIGKVGNDPFGHYLKTLLQEAGIDTEGLNFTDEAGTTLVFVHLDSRERISCRKRENWITRRSAPPECFTSGRYR